MNCAETDTVIMVGLMLINNGIQLSCRQDMIVRIGKRTKIIQRLVLKVTTLLITIRMWFQGWLFVSR